MKLRNIEIDESKWNCVWYQNWSVWLRNLYSFLQKLRRNLHKMVFMVSRFIDIVEKRRNEFEFGKVSKKSQLSFTFHFFKSKRNVRTFAKTWIQIVQPDRTILIPHINELTKNVFCFQNNCTGEYNHAIIILIPIRIGDEDHGKI